MERYYSLSLDRYVKEDPVVCVYDDDLGCVVHRFPFGQRVCRCGARCVRQKLVIQKNALAFGGGMRYAQ